MATFPRKLLKWTAGTFAVLVILIALGLGAFRIVLAQVPDYRTQIQSWVSERSGVNVEFAELDARWRLYGPELVFESAVVLTPDGRTTLVKASRGSVAFDIWASLASGRLTTGRFWLDAPELVLVRTTAGRIELVGQDALPERAGSFSFDSLPTGRFSVSNARVTFRDLATGRGPLVFERVGLTLSRESNAMSLAGVAELPSTLGRQLEFSARSSGQLDDPANLRWNFSVEGSDFDLAGLADLLPEVSPGPAAGIGSFQLAGVLSGARIEEITGKLDIAGVVLSIPAWTHPMPTAAPLAIRTIAADGTVTEMPLAVTTSATPQPASGTERIAYDQVRADFRLQRTSAAGWQLAIDGLQLVRPGMRWDPSRIELNLEGERAGQLAVGGTVEFASLESLWPLLGFLPDRADTARLRAFAASGRVRDLRFQFARETGDANLKFSLAGQAEEVTFAPVGRIAGVGGITGSFVTSEQSGRLDLAAREMSWSLPRLFRETLHADLVTGTLTWDRTADRWQIASDHVEIENEDGSLTARFELAIPNDGSSPILDLAATARDVDATATPRYLPAGRLTSRTLAWLDSAFPAGVVQEATVEVHGPTREFPFRAGAGAFVARGKAQGVTLQYGSGWDPLSEVSGEFEFRNAGLTANTTSGLLEGMRMTQGQVEIADLKTPELDIQAKVAGDLGQALVFLQRSPIGLALGERFMSLDGRGATDFDVHLWLPIRQPGNRKTDVTARLVAAELGQRQLTQKLTDLNGSLQVLDRTVVSPGLQGRFLGGPVAIVLNAEPGIAGAPATTALSANGRAEAAPLADLFGIPERVNLAGSTSWRMQARFDPQADSTRAAGAPPSLAQSYVIDSDLTGLAIGLPEPLQKSMAESWPLNAEVENAGGTTLLVRGSLGELRTVARLQLQQGIWSFDRAGIRADGVAASIPDHTGVRIEGDVSRVVLDEWLQLKGSGTSADRRLSDYLKAANVRIGSLGLFGYTWSDVRGLLQTTPAGWQIDLAGPDATGQLLIPYEFTTGAPVRLAMDRLAIAAPAGGSRLEKDTDPRKVPAIQARVNDLVLGERHLGNVRLQLDRVPRGLAINEFTAEGESFSGELKGSWLAFDTASAAVRSVVTTIETTLTSTDVQATLKALGYADVIAARHGQLRAKLNLPGGPGTGALALSSGTVHLEFNDGQVLNLQPGAGRVLGLFSVAALPRRLSLDFRDLTDEGLSFDSVRGDFDLKQGNAYTSNLLLSGPAAEIGIAGRTGLATRDYDQTAVVTGNVSGTLPVAGVLAGGPVVGAAMLLFAQVFKEPLKGITRGYYRITGSWNDPQVERVIASDAKETAAQEPPAAPSATPSPGPSTNP